MSFKIKGTVVEKESGKGLSGLVVKAYDKDLLYDDLLGSIETDHDGKFQITYEEKDYQELFDSKPDIYLEIKNVKGEMIYSSEEKVRFGACAEENFKVEIPHSLLPTINNDYGNDINANYTSVDLRSLMVVLNRAKKMEKLEEIFNAFQEVNKANPKTVLLLPSLMLNALISKFAFLSLCSGTTATSTVTIGTGKVLSPVRTVGFSYTFTGAPPCSVKVQSVTLLVAARTLPVIELSDTGSAYVGSIPVSAGVLTVGTPVTINVTFKASAAGWCNTCNLPVPLVTKGVTISIS